MICIRDLAAYAFQKKNLAAYLKKRVECRKKDRWIGRAEGGLNKEESGRSRSIECEGGMRMQTEESTGEKQ